ncbi:MAG: amidoligase family protein [Rhodobacteraceae bacterium]|nr:amidoligase family protein [Paracoccaceae bacterium]
MEDLKTHASVREMTREMSLPDPMDREGKPRRVGVEIELGGLSEQAVAEIVRAHLGGEIERRAAHVLLVRQTRLGDLQIYLDTAYKEPGNAALEQALELGRGLIPVEIVTEPVEIAALEPLDALVDRLREDGAKGTEDQLFNGYGVHFNVSAVSLSAGDIVPVVRAFALLEDWLRAALPIDITRRLLPFVSPYPRAFVDAVAREGADWTLEDLTRHYLEKTPTRNRALDLLPLLREADEAQVVEALGKDAESVNARPAFHYRLPDSRIGEPDWSLLREWRRWCLVEQVASRPELLTHLSEAWIDYRDALTTLPGDWIRTVDEALSRAFGTEAPA